MRILAVSLAVASLAGAMLVAPGASLAQVTQSYSYDANGRLTGVVTTGGSGTHTAAYGYDAANNRTSRSQSGVTTWAAVTQLPIDQLLQPNEALISPDGHYSFALRSSGQLELWSDDTLATFNAHSLLTAFRLTDDGQARFLPASPTEIPSAGTWVSLRDDGLLALLDEAGNEVWRSGDATGQEAGQ